MALQVFTAGRPATPGRGEARDSTLALGEGAGGWAREDARHEIAERDFNRIAATARSKRKSKHETISQVCATYHRRTGHDTEDVRYMFALEGLFKSRWLIVGTRFGEEEYVEKVDSRRCAQEFRSAFTLHLPLDSFHYFWYSGVAVRKMRTASSSPAMSPARLLPSRSRCCFHLPRCR